MSDDRTGSATAERGLQGSDQSVATFEEDGRSGLKSLQRFLHEYPTAIPFIVLIVGILIFLGGGRRSVLRAVQSVARSAAGHHHRLFWA